MKKTLLPSLTSTTVAEEFSSSCEGDSNTWCEPAGGSPFVVPSAGPASGHSSSPVLSRTGPSIVGVVNDIGDDDADEYCTIASTFQLSRRPDSWSDKKCEKIVKYAEKRLAKLERSSSSYKNCHKLIRCQAPTVRHDQIQLGDVIGKGAFSNVYSVVSINSKDDGDDGINKNSSSLSRDKVVVKFLRSKLYQNPAMLAACAGDLCKEGIILSTLSHSNILKVLATSPSGVNSYANGCHDAFFLVLEKLDHTLSDRLTVWLKNRIFVKTKKAGCLSRGNVNRRLQKVLSDSTTGSAPESMSSPPSSGRDIDRTRKCPIKAAGLGRRLFSRRGSHQSSSRSILPNIISLDERLDVSLQLADAIAYLHSQGVLHRDLKPDNLGFTVDGVLKVFDFDVSRRVPASMRDEYNQIGIESTVNESRNDPKETTLLMTRRVGSPRYMCPEAARGEEYNLKADVYTYTLLLYEILVLEKPYDDIANEDHDEFVFYRHVRPHIPSGLPAELKQLIQRGWSENVQIRPTMPTMIYFLDQYLPRLLPETTSTTAMASSSSVLSNSISSIESTGKFHRNDPLSSPTPTSVCTAPLTANTAGTSSSNGDSGRQHRRSISKALRVSLLRRCDCVPSLVTGEP